jgi:hypothetical protein
MKRIATFRLFENQENLIDEVKNLINNVPPIKHLSDEVTEESIKEYDKWIYVKLKDELDSAHINKHFDVNNPGSTFTVSKEELSKIMSQIMMKEPTEKAQENVFKYKWLGIDAGKIIGKDSLVKVDGDIEMMEDKEPFGMVNNWKKDTDINDFWNKVESVAKTNNYNLVDETGKVYKIDDLEAGKKCFIRQEIGVIEGEKKDTSLINIITAKIGEANGKDVLTLMTVYPGINAVDKDGKPIINKKDFAAAGYALIVPKKPIKENYGRIKTFGNFR